MNTFLPFRDFTATAKVLDYRRLGKQRVECKQILATLMGESQGWKNHPAVKMWKFYESSLCQYAIEICTEWKKRGYKDNLLPWFEDKLLVLPNSNEPSWNTNEELHASHRSNLLRKDPVYYGRFGWSEESNLPYIWPKEKEFT